MNTTPKILRDIELGDKPADNRIQICETIASDAEKDAEAFDGQPFDGKTVATYLGYHGASIATLAKLIKSILQEKQPNT